MFGSFAVGAPRCEFVELFLVSWGLGDLRVRHPLRERTSVCTLGTLGSAVSCKRAVVI